MSVTYNKINAFVADQANKVHNLGSDQLTVFLTDSAPVATNITQISYTNLSTRNLTVTASTQSSGTYKLVANQLTLTASGAVAQFRYVGIYNSTASGGPLIAWYDYGSEVNMVNTDTFVVALDLTNGILQTA